MRLEVLHVIKKLSARIEKEEIKLLRLNALARSTTAELDGLPHNKTESSKVEQIAIRIFECKETISLLKKVRILCRIELNNLLEVHVRNPAQCQVLFLRYGLCKAFKVIGRELGYSESTVFKLHKAGLKALELKQSLSEIWEFDKVIV